MAAVTAQVAALKEAQAAMVRDVAALAAERDELAAKNEVLVGMVAEADVAMDRLEGDLEEERLKVEAMKWCVVGAGAAGRQGGVVVGGNCAGCTAHNRAPRTTPHAATCRKVATECPPSVAAAPSR